MLPIPLLYCVNPVHLELLKILKFKGLNRIEAHSELTFCQVVTIELSYSWTYLQYKKDTKLSIVVFYPLCIQNSSRCITKFNCYQGKLMEPKGMMKTRLLC